MFYEPKDGHGLPYNPFNALVTPRPIGWISTHDGQGHDNLAPYSFFNAVAYVPPQVMFSSTGVKEDQDETKDTVANIRQTGVFCVNILGREMLDAMNISSTGVDRDVDEFARAGLDKISCTTIKCPRIANIPAALECKMTQIVRLDGPTNFVVLGEVRGIYMNDAYIEDGKFDVSKFTPVGRMGYRDYTVAETIFELRRPDDYSA